MAWFRDSPVRSLNMRPDAYKRARSRQYKIKHGLISTNKFPNPESNIPSNTIADQLLGSIEHEGKVIIKQTTP